MEQAVHVEFQAERFLGPKGHEASDLMVES